MEQGELEEFLNESIFGLDYIKPWMNAFKLRDFGESLEVVVKINFLISFSCR